MLVELPAESCLPQASAFLAERLPEIFELYDRIEASDGYAVRYLGDDQLLLLRAVFGHGFLHVLYRTHPPASR